jgi:hypothetical protein
MTSSLELSSMPVERDLRHGADEKSHLKHRKATPEQHERVCYDAEQTCRDRA